VISIKNCEAIFTMIKVEYKNAVSFLDMICVFSLYLLLLFLVDEPVDFMKDSTGVFEPTHEWKTVEPGNPCWYFKNRLVIYILIFANVYCKFVRAFLCYFLTFSIHCDYNIFGVLV